jgi:hypothetical protein
MKIAPSFHLSRFSPRSNRQKQKNFHSYLRLNKGLMVFDVFYFPENVHSAARAGFRQTGPPVKDKPKAKSPKPALNHEAANEERKFLKDRLLV